MKLYLCGLPTMLEPDRMEAFAAASRELSDQGHESQSPYTTGFSDRNTSTDTALLNDEQALAGADAVVVIDDRHVECYETVIASISGKPVLHLSAVLQLKAG